jgi:hypothetical protein
MPITFDEIVDEMEQVYKDYDDPIRANDFIDGEIYALYILNHISLEEYNVATAKAINLYQLHKYDNNDD